MAQLINQFLVVIVRAEGRKAGRQGGGPPDR